MIDQELEENIQFAFKDARERGLEFVTVEHLLWVLLDSREIAKLFDSIKAERGALRVDLENFLSTRVPRAAADGHDTDIRPTPGFQRVIRRAVMQAKDGGDTAVTGVNVLLAVYFEPESFGARFLARHGITLAKVSGWLSKRPSVRPTLSPAQSSEDCDGLTRELVKAASENQFDVPHQRDDVIRALLRVLCRKYKRNPVLVGEPGVGKSALVRSVAHMAASGSLPATLENLEIHEVDVSSLVAGTRYRGDFEARMKKLVAMMSTKPEKLLYIDEIHTLIGAGSVSGGTLDAAHILKPALADGRLRCIGTTTPAEYARVFAKDSALSRRFQKVDVNEPDADETDAILAGILPRLESHHGISYAPGTPSAARRLAGRYISARKLPDNAIDLLDEAGASAVLDGSQKNIDECAMLAAVERMSGLPAGAVHGDDRAALRGLERALTRKVFGQREAARELSSAVRRAHLGARRPNRPVGAYLFAGPTGVGKTAMAVALAEALGVELLRFDMSEYIERHAVSRLIGAPPGYVGYEQAGQLTEKVAHCPHCVVLLDEIEKAHPDIHGILLQVMDYGALTDNSGQQVDFANAALIMTTNAGAAGWERLPLGFTGGDPQGSEKEAVGKLFSPEFRNRLNAVIRFAPLPRKVATAVVDKELRLLAQRFADERGIRLRFGKRLSPLLVDLGFSATLGARPLQRAIDSAVVDAVVNEQLRKPLRKGSALFVDVNKSGEVSVRREMAAAIGLDA